MRAGIHASLSINGPARASAAEPPADPRQVEQACVPSLSEQIFPPCNTDCGLRCHRAAWSKVSWKQYQKNCLPETRVLSAFSNHAQSWCPFMQSSTPSHDVWCMILTT